MATKNTPIGSISITPTRRSGTRRAAVPALAELAEPIQPAIRRPQRPSQAQPIHRYHVGERLRISGGGSSIARREAFCRVVALLPYEGHGSLLYRIRSETEAFERVVIEADLSRNTEALS